MICTVDIETIPSGEKLKKEDIKAPGSYKKKESIDKWIDENWEAEVEKEYRKRALIPHKCQVICWAIKVKGKVYSLHAEDEGELTKELNEALKDLSQSPYGISWVGVNIRNFDVVILKQRAWKYGCNFLAQALSHGKIIDLMDDFTGSKSKEYLASKDTMCEFFGIENEDKHDGSEVYDLYLKGDKKAILNHCVFDVEVEEKIYLKMNPDELEK